MSRPVRDPTEDASEVTSGEKVKDVAVATTMPSDPTALVEAVGEDLDHASSRDRYVRENLLGIGGMGEVHLCKDRVTGRLVALKVMDAERAKMPELRARFLREARVQGQLEHPSIVPVYDIARDSAGERYFTMKRIAGVTLDDVLASVAARDPWSVKRFSRKKLLEIFCELCLVVDYAHSRGVIHRDIKPQNTMIGELGELYLLDWGLAKIASASGVDVQDEHTPQTVEGQILGTPGYMAPEQATSANTVDKRADIYALGAILFEILTLQPLHSGDGARALLHSTHVGADARASIRAPEQDVPPELEAVCVKATADEPRGRFASARELYEAVDRYLQGDRDVGLRRELATRHAEAAEEAAMRALTSSNPGIHRSRGLQHAGRALALEPDSAGAQRALMALLLEPPPDLPPEVSAAVEQHAAGEARFASAVGVVFYSVFFFGALLHLAAFGKKRLVAILILVPLLLAAVACANSFRPKFARYSENTLLISFLVSLSIGSAAALYGPLILIPTLAAANAAAVNMASQKARRWVHPVLGSVSIIVPFVLEWMGVIPRSYLFEHNTITVVSSAIHLTPAMTQITLPLFSVLAIVGPTLTAWRLSDALTDVRRYLHIQMWHLEQLVPGRKMRD